MKSHYFETLQLYGKDTTLANTKELALLVDLTGSQNYGITRHDSTPRHQVLHDAVKIFVRKLSELDTAGEEEAGGGGVLAFGFSKTARTPQGYVEIGDLNPSNFENEWSDLRFTGSTYIMPAFKAALAAYDQEFGDEDPPPDYALLVATDGALEDEAEFEGAMAHLRQNMVVEIVLVGEGDDTYGVHDAYERLASRSNDRVHVTSLVGTTSPDTIASHLLQAITA